MNKAEPQISIAIVNWNTREYLVKCLQALRAGAAGLTLEIIVVDNASSDGSAKAVAEQFPEIQLLANRENLGFAAGINQALNLAQAPFCMLLNPDTEMQPQALQIMLEDLEAHPEAWAVGPKLLNGDGSILPSGRKFPTMFSTWMEGLLPRRVKASDWWKKAVFGRLDFEVPVEVNEVSGACFITRQKVFEKIGFLDERFFLYYEEVDWFLRLAAAGGKVRYQPRARIIHHWGAGANKTQGESVLLYYRSQFKFWRKHHRGEIVIRIMTACNAVVWTVGSLIKALGLGEVRRNLPVRLPIYIKLFFLALGLRK
ncbi:glycosyltransferase family 2 protein [bacterium]|nr:glycosyltransferase family 2 protein [bacterium]